MILTEIEWLDVSQDCLSDWPKFLNSSLGFDLSQKLKELHFIQGLLDSTAAQHSDNLIETSVSVQKAKSYNTTSWLS